MYQGHGCNRFITGIGRDDESGFNQVNSKAADSTDDVGNVYSDILTIQPSGSFTNDLSLFFGEMMTKATTRSPKDHLSVLNDLSKPGLFRKRAPWVT